MFGPTPPAAVLEQYAQHLAGLSCEYLDSAGGLSGARLWRFAGTDQAWLLRQWPAEHPSPARLAWIHAVLRHVAKTGFTRFAPPELTRSGNSWVYHEGQFWELARWLPGEASYGREPGRGKLVAACATLAQFHCATGGMPEQLQRGKPSSLASRLEVIKGLRRKELEQMQAAIGRTSDTLVAGWAARFFPLAVGQLVRLDQMLTQVSAMQLPLQPCIGDVWYENVLFVGDEVSGLIDFGAMRSDCVASDIARLLGSMAENDAAAWEQGLAAYELQRPLTPRERSMVPVYDQSGVALSGLNWLRWLLLEGRVFNDRTKVQSRLEHLLRRIEALPTGSG